MEIQLVVTSGKYSGKAVLLKKSNCIIGSAEDCDLRLASSRVSPHHCAVLVRNGVVAVRPLDRHGATCVNGDEVHKAHRLEDGDRIRVGPVEFALKTDAPAANTEPLGLADLPDESPQPGAAHHGDQDHGDEEIKVVGVSKHGRWHPTTVSASDAAADALKAFNQRLHR